jgi:serine/threonine-protein kinase
LRSPIAGDGDARAAFLAEATRTRAIDHPAVVRVLDFGCEGDDFYLVMERLDGETLATRLARVGRLDEAEVRRIGAAVADGAAAAHERGIVHRDLKPGNIMLVGDQPKIVDFGIARQLDPATAATTGSRTGTPAYMAPEQLTGGLLAPCVDVWALGVILHEALAGQLPFDGFADGRCPQLFETRRPLGELATVSPALEALIGRCLDRDPGKRPPSMAAIARALRARASEDRITEDLTAPPGREQRGDVDPHHAAPSVPAARHSVRRWLAAAALTAVAALATGVAWRLRDDPARSAAAASTLDPPSTSGLPASAKTRPSESSSNPGGQGSQTVPSDPSASPGPASATTSAGDASSRPGTTSPVTAPGESSATMPRDPSSSRSAAAFTIRVRSAPAGATLIVDGKRVGVTPATIELPAPASILVTRSGYQPSRVKAERPGPILVRLVPLPRNRQHRPAAGETLD